MIIKIKGNELIRATEGSAGFDLSSSEDLIVYKGGNVLVPTGIYWEPPQRCNLLGNTAYTIVGKIYSRSGNASKLGLIVSSGVGIIDEDYRGEIKVPVTIAPWGDDMHKIYKGDRVAQIVFSMAIAPKIVYVEELSKTVRGTGGFGSTGS